MNEPKDWFMHHMKRCLSPFIDARECQVEKKVEAIRQMKSFLSEEQWEEFQKRMRYQAYASQGTDESDKLWNPELDVADYFKEYRAHMESILKEEPTKEEAMENFAHPSKYMPKKFWKDTQVYFDDTK